MMFRRMQGIATCFLVLAPIVGCGGASDGPERYDVSGTVTYDGQPVPQGTIQFRPDASQGNKGPASNAQIVNGRYDTAESGKGTVGGPHVVIIHGFDGDARPEEELPMGNPLFTDYNTTADLPKSSDQTMDFEVEP